MGSLDRLISRLVRFRSIEILAQRRTHIQHLTLVQRVCGICSRGYTMTFCVAAETAAGMQVPARVHHIRVIIADLERRKFRTCSGPALAQK